MINAWRDPRCLSFSEDGAFAGAEPPNDRSASSIQSKGTAPHVP